MTNAALRGKPDAGNPHVAPSQRWRGSLLYTFGIAALCATTALAEGFDEKTIAFYPFKEGAPGTSAVGVTITNLIDNAKFRGTVTSTGGGEVFFSDECPGRYLFTNLTYGADCVYENPGSLYFTNTTSTSSYAALFIEDIVRSLNEAVAAQGSANGAWKIEFFYKLHKDQIISKSKSDAETTFITLKNVCDLYSGDTSNPDNLAYTNCSASARFYDNGAAQKRLVYLKGYSKATGQLSGRIDGNIDSSSNDDVLKNGRWHYISISSAINNISFAGRPDYRLSGNGFRFSAINSGSKRVKYYTVMDPDGQFPLIINPEGGFRGWISCLKVTKSPADSNVNIDAAFAENDNMYASDLATCVPRTLTHLRFEDGQCGNAVAATIVNKVKLADINTRMTYYSGANGQHGGISYGDATLYAEDASNSTVVYTNDVWHRLLLDGAAAKIDSAVSNTLSIAAVPQSPDSPSKYVQGVGIMLNPKDRMRLYPTTPLTFEFFMKFDYEGWKARVADVATETGKRVNLFFMPYAGKNEYATSGYSCNLRLYMDLTDESNPKLGISGWTTGDGTLFAVPRLLNGKWHHVAFSYAPVSAGNSTANCIVYFDYQQIGTTTVSTYSPDQNQNRRYMHFMRGMTTGNSNAYGHGYMGEIDEIRISCGILGPGDFLRQKNDAGLFIVFR